MRPHCFSLTGLIRRSRSPRWPIICDITGFELYSVLRSLDDLSFGFLACQRFSSNLVMPDDPYFVTVQALNSIVLGGALVTSVLAFWPLYSVFLTGLIE